MSVELLPPDKTYPTDRYHVRPNYCTCHPETCCCNDWAVHAPDGTKEYTKFSRHDAIVSANRINLTTGCKVCE